MTFKKLFSSKLLLVSFFLPRSLSFSFSLYLSIHLFLSLLSSHNIERFPHRRNQSKVSKREIEIEKISSSSSSSLIMGTGWRRAFCTSISRDPDSNQQQKQSNPSTPSPRNYIKFGFRSSSTSSSVNGGSSNPSTPRVLQQSKSTVSSSSSTTSSSLRCRTTTSTPTVSASAPTSAHNSPRLHCKTKSPRFFHSSAPSSPKSPSRFSIFKSSLRLSKSSCGICLQSVKTGQGTAIFTAECSHAFHFPCIAAHVRKHGILVCPVCSTNWREVPLLAIHKNLPPPPDDQEQKKKNNKKEEQQHRFYDDDEPLLSPTGTARFNTIPEADHEDDEDDEIQEFQGFFTDPNRSSTSVLLTSDLELRNAEVKLLPVSAVVSSGRSYETYAVALKVKAPPSPARSNTNASILDPSRRAPIDLVTVLDVSGSMTGAKLQMLKRAMRLVISSLSSSDRLSIVAFSATTKRLLPLKRMSVSGQRFARRIIDRLSCGQGSSVGDALRKATKVLEDRRERNPVASIMLLSDGSSATPASHQRQGFSHVSSTRFAHLEIPVHASGFGENGGRPSNEPAEDAFAKCVGGLLSVVVQDLRLKISFSSGSSPAEISAVYSCSGKPQFLGSNSVKLGDLYAEEERELLVELKVPMTNGAVHHVMTVRCCHKDPATQEIIYGKESPLLVPRPHAVRSTAPKIERLRNLFITTRAIAEARRLVEHNDLANAYNMISSARALLKQSNSISSDEYLRSLESELTEIQWRRQPQHQPQQVQRRRTNEPAPTPVPAHLDESIDQLTPTSAWRAAERLAKVAIMRKSMNRVSDLHGFENARF